jgi:hypothetical protein
MAKKASADKRAPHDIGDIHGVFLKKPREARIQGEARCAIADNASIRKARDRALKVSS